MGSKLEKTARRGLKAVSTGGLSEAKVVGKKLEEPIKTGASGARRDAAQALKAQQQKESIKLAETESEIATKRAMAKSGKGGRQSLIKSSPTGLAQNLGGTQ